MFLELHEYDTSFGGGVVAIGAPSASVPPPNVHVPPALHVHAAPSHVQSPEHVSDAGGSLPPHAATSETPSAKLVNVTATHDERAIDIRVTS